MASVDQDCCLNGLRLHHCAPTLYREPGMLLDPKGLRIMPPPGLHICLQPLMTLTFYLWSPKVDHHLCIEIGYLLSKYHVHKTDGQKDGQTGGHIESIVPPLASWTWRRHKNVCRELSILLQESEMPLLQFPIIALVLHRFGWDSVHPSLPRNVFDLTCCHLVWR